MGEVLVGAMVAALRRVNRDRAEAARASRPARPESSAWGYLAHPALMPTVYSPSGDASDADAEAPGEEVAARKV